MKTFIILLLSLTINSQAEEIKSIDKNAVRLAIKKNNNSFKKCYTDELKNIPNLEGKVIAKWEINELGAVKYASIKSSALKNEAVESCILLNIKAIKFPEAPKGSIAEVSYPFMFKPSK